MISIALFWLLLTFLTIIITSFYSMQEMAMVSINKVRLQYYVSKGDKRATWINTLLNNPSTLFSTTLLGVNISMMIGSECSRHLYAALNLNPNFAPITQIFVVLILGELAPIFAARRYPERLAMFGVPIVYLTSLIMAPLIWVVNGIARFTNWIIGGNQDVNHIFISREEFQTILEAKDGDIVAAPESDAFNALARNIFTIRHKKAADAMEPLSNVSSIPSSCTVGHMRQILKGQPASFLPVFHRSTNDIVAVAFPRDLIKVSDNERVRDHARSPWFIAQETELMQILQQFRRNSQTVAIVLDFQGRAVGVLTLDDIVEEIFGEMTGPDRGLVTPRKTLLIERTFPGDTLIVDFNKQFGVRLESYGAETLAELVELKVGHHPERGETVFVDPFELMVEDTSLTEVKSVRVKTRTR